MTTQLNHSPLIRGVTSQPADNSHLPGERGYLFGEDEMTTHTPGLWETSGEWVGLGKDHKVIYVHPVESSETVCQCWRTGCDRGLTERARDQETEANARLIAAAPDLLEACKAIMAHWRMNDEAYYKSDLATDLLQAISKAEGKE